ncbi:MAG: DUF2461 family protein, partial [Myxococcales bacterium]|nr:DUF2461 family protein [Myxococcales bacterium]
VVGPAQEFVADLGDKLKEFAPDVVVDPAYGRGVSTITRTRQVAGDYLPFRTHLDLRFWEGEGDPWEAPAFFIRVEAERLTIGAGIVEFGPVSSSAFREAILDPVESEALTLALAAVEDSGPYEVGGRGSESKGSALPGEMKHANLLRSDGVYAAVSGPVPGNFYTKRFIDYCLAHFKNLLPLHTWLVDVMNRAQ